MIQRSVCLLARECRGMRKGATQCWPPEGHFIVRLERACLAHRPSRSQKRYPETERQGGNHMRRVNRVSGSRKFALCLLDTSPTAKVQARFAHVIPGMTKFGLKPGVHGIAQRKLEGLQGTIQSCACCRIPDMKPQCPFQIATNRVPVCLQARRRKYRNQSLKTVRVHVKVLDCGGPIDHICGVGPGPASALPGMRPGLSLSHMSDLSCYIICLC